VTDESELEGVLRLLFSVIGEQHDQNKGLERLVGLGIEKSFSSTIDGVIIEKVAVETLCRKVLPYCPPYALQEHTHFPLQVS
jgi:hypothetical protein